jgi:hypothetical protein
MRPGMCLGKSGFPPLISMKAFSILTVIVIVFAVWYYCGNLPPTKVDEGARLLDEAAAREKANAAERDERAAVVARLRARADEQKLTEEQDRNSSLAQDDAAMARERLRSWRQKTSPGR